MMGEAAAATNEDDKGTALDDGGAAAAAAAATALESGGTPPDPDALLEIPDKFKGEDGALNEQGILKSYGDLEKQFRALGKPPETADDYEVETKFPEGVEVNEENHKEFLGRCHEKGMTNDMVQFIMDEYAGIVTDAVVQSTEGREEVTATLKEHYGADYHDKMASAMNAFRAANLKDVDIKDVGNNPAAIKVLAVLGANLTEDLLPKGEVPLSGTTDEEIATIMRSPEYWDKKASTHLELNAKVRRHYDGKIKKKK